MMNHKLLFLFRTMLSSVFLLACLTACDDWTEMEVHDFEVNGAAQQNPEQYAAYTQSLRAYKATKHAVVYARFDNAPEVSTSDKDFLRALPDSIDIVTMRNANRLTDYDREDMKLVRTDYGTKVLYYVDASTLTADGLNAAISAAAAAVKEGTFDGITLASSSAVDAATVKALTDAIGQTSCLLVFEGNPSLVSEAQRSAFNYFVLDVSEAADEYDIDAIVLHAIDFGKISAEHILLAVTPEGSITDYDGVTRTAISGAAHSALSMETPLGGIAIYDVSTDYYDADIIYKRTRGGIQLLNPAASH